VFGFTECIDLLAEYVVVCIDEFELDDPGNTTLVSRLLSRWSSGACRSRRRRTRCPNSSARPLRRAGLPARDQHARNDFHHRADRGAGLPAPRTAAGA
jgi:hypothetical protein